MNKKDNDSINNYARAREHVLFTKNANLISAVQSLRSQYLQNLSQLYGTRAGNGEADPYIRDVDTALGELTVELMALLLKVTKKQAKKTSKG